MVRRSSRGVVVGPRNGSGWGGLLAVVGCGWRENGSKRRARVRTFWRGVRGSNSSVGLRGGEPQVRGKPGSLGRRGVELVLEETA